MRFFFGLAAAALIFAAICGAALTYDGSYYLYGSLEDQHPMIPNRREIHGPLQWPVIWASHTIKDTGVMELLFDAMYVSVPFVALAASWWIVRKTAPWLFLWAALGSCIAMLPGQIGFISEGTFVMQLAWPIFLAVLTRIRWRHLPLLIFFCYISLVTHPFAVAVFGAAAFLAFVTGLHYTDQRRERWLWAAVLTALTIFTLVRFLTSVNSYESGQLETGLLWMRFTSSVLGAPLIALVLAMIASGFILFRHRQALPNFQNIWPLRLAEYGLITAVGVTFLIWAAFPVMWADALSYRFFLVPFAAPFILFALLDSLALNTGRPPSDSAPSALLWKHRRRLTQAVGLIFALTLAVQSFVWLNMTNQLRDTLAQSQTACLTTDSPSLAWTARTALNHWSITPYAVMVQGRTVTKIVEPPGGCAADKFARGFWLAPWDLKAWQGHYWFDFSRLEQQMKP
jgi:hypothetical protein